MACILREHGKRVHLHALVVMPEHVHLLLTPLYGTNELVMPIQKVLQAVKSISAREINKLVGRRGSIWDEESLDHILRSHESFEEKRQYIEQNPVRRGLVQHSQEYRWLWVNPEDVV